MLLAGLSEADAEMGFGVQDAWWGGPAPVNGNGRKQGGQMGTWTPMLTDRALVGSRERGHHSVG